MMQVVKYHIFLVLKEKSFGTPLGDIASNSSFMPLQEDAKNCNTPMITQISSDTVATFFELQSLITGAEELRLDLGYSPWIISEESPGLPETKTICIAPRTSEANFLCIQHSPSVEEEHEDPCSENLLYCTQTKFAKHFTFTVP